MVVGIRHLIGFLSTGAVLFVRISIFPGPYAYSRDFSGKAMLQDLSNDPTVPVHGVYKREGNLHTY